MKTYRRILVPLPAGGQNDFLLSRAAELARTQNAKMLVVRVLDTSNGFESDGPAAVLPGDAASRRAPEVKKRLELQLARNNLGWVEAKVAWGEPVTVLADVIRSWQPDLMVTLAGHLPQALTDGVDALTVSRPGLFSRLAEAFHHPSPRHA
jgi:nucleotide-binding universal stress UspA family protein